MMTVATPAPTAASVKATSTASRTTNMLAESRLKKPETRTTPKRLRRRATTTATTAMKPRRTMSTSSTIDAVPSFS